MKQALRWLGGHGCLDFPVSDTLFWLVMLVQRPKETWEEVSQETCFRGKCDSEGLVLSAPWHPGGGDKIV